MKKADLILAGYKQATHIILFNPYISLQTKTTVVSEGIWWALERDGSPRAINKEKPLQEFDSHLPDSLWCKVNKSSIDIAAIDEDIIARTTHIGNAHISWSDPNLKARVNHNE